MYERKRIGSPHKHAHMLSQAPGSHSISGYSIHELQCPWQCYKVKGTENPLTQCPYISYAAANPYSKCLRVIWNITVGLCVSMPYAECVCAVDLLDPLSKFSALTLFLRKGETWRWVCITSMSVTLSSLRSLLSVLVPTSKAKYFLPLFCHELESSSFSDFLSQTSCG